MAVTLSNNSVSENQPAGTVVGNLNLTTNITSSEITSGVSWEPSNFRIVTNDWGYHFTGTAKPDTFVYYPTTQLSNTPIKLKSNTQAKILKSIRLPAIGVQGQGTQTQWFPGQTQPSLPNNYYYQIFIEDSFHNPIRDPRIASGYSNQNYPIATSNQLTEIPFGNISLNSYLGGNINLYPGGTYNIIIKLFFPQNATSNFSYKLGGTQVWRKDAGTTYTNSLFEQPDSISSSLFGTYLTQVNNNNSTTPMTSGVYNANNFTLYNLLWLMNFDDQGTLSLLQSGSYNDFNIINNQLVTTKSFDYEQSATKSITIRQTFSDNTFIDTNFTINITDIIDTPTNITLSNSSIVEGLSINSTIGMLSGIDPNNRPLTFSVRSNSEKFNIDNNILRSSIVFDYETETSYNTIIRATNDLGGFYDKTFTINVINTAPTSISLSSVTISENASAQATVATINASDPAGGTCTFTFDTGVGSEDNNSFQIVGSLLKLAANVTLNYELKNSYNIKIKATDPGGLSYSQTFTINVTNINEAPYNLELSSNSILENSPVNTIIGLLSASDVDQNDSLIFSVLVGTTNFNISGNQLRSSVVFDYENTTSQSVTIRATDSGGLYVDKQFTINVLNVNEAPTSITISNSSILENNAIGDVIGTLSATDPENNSVTFSLDTVNDYASFSITGNQLKAATVFNRELKNLYTIRVIATDTNNNTFAQTLNISIGNRVEPPLNISLSSTQILENNLTDAIIGTLSAIDPEGGTISFSVVDGADKFNVVSVGGIWKLRASVSFDYATQAQHSVTVRATNANSEYADKTFSIEILEYIEPETVNLTNQQYTLADSGKAYVETIYDPTVVGLLIDGAALVPGSVVINSNSGQKYLKLTGNMTDYYVIPLNAKPEWVWSTSGYAIWQII